MIEEKQMTEVMTEIQNALIPPKVNTLNAGQIAWGIQTMNRLGYDGRVHPDIPARLARWMVPAVKHWTNKGLLLAGGVGMGKTHFFDRVLRAIYPEFVLWRASQIVEMAATNRENFEEVVYGRYEGQNLYTEAVLAIDDLGDEPYGNVYGNKGEVMARVICDRYETWKRRGIPLFISTNLETDEILSRYGQRVADRIREMCFTIRLHGQNARK